MKAKVYTLLFSSLLCVSALADKRTLAEPTNQRDKQRADVCALPSIYE